MVGLGWSTAGDGLFLVEGGKPGPRQGGGGASCCSRRGRLASAEQGAGSRGSELMDDWLEFRLLVR